MLKIGGSIKAVVNARVIGSEHGMVVGCGCAASPKESNITGIGCRSLKTVSWWGFSAQGHLVQDAKLPPGILTAKVETFQIKVVQCWVAGVEQSIEVHGCARHHIANGSLGIGPSSLERRWRSLGVEGKSIRDGHRGLAVGRIDRKGSSTALGEEVAAIRRQVIRVARAVTMTIDSVRRRLGVVIGTKNGSQGFRRRIVKVLSLLPNSILASIRKTTLDASLTRSFISCNEDVSPRSFLTNDEACVEEQDEGTQIRSQLNPKVALQTQRQASRQEQTKMRTQSARSQQS